MKIKGEQKSCELCQQWSVFLNSLCSNCYFWYCSYYLWSVLDEEGFLSQFSSDIDFTTVTPFLFFFCWLLLQFQYHCMWYVLLKSWSVGVLCFLIFPLPLPAVILSSFLFVLTIGGWIVLGYSMFNYYLYVIQFIQHQSH